MSVNVGNHCVVGAVLLLSPLGSSPVLIALQLSALSVFLAPSMSGTSPFFCWPITNRLDLSPRAELGCK